MTGHARAFSVRVHPQRWSPADGPPYTDTEPLVTPAGKPGNARPTGLDRRTDMAQMTNLQERLRNASGLGSVLGASCEAFEAMLRVIRAHEDPGSVFFAPLVMVAALAADGRDASGSAPSMSRLISRSAADTADRPLAASAESAVRVVADLAQLAEVRLTRVAGQAVDPDDREACEQAARCAAAIYELLGGGEP